MEDPDDAGPSLHDRLLAGDPTAFAQIAERYLSPLVARLRRKFPASDPDLIDHAVMDALLNYRDRPTQFDPTRRTLGGYLLMSARGDLLNSLHETRTNFVELDAATAEYQVEIADETEMEPEVWARLSPVWERLHAILDNPIDEQIVLLMMDGVRETSEYAQVLGIATRPPGEQELEVKRHKDRIKARIRRHLDPSELRDHE